LSDTSADKSERGKKPKKDTRKSTAKKLNVSERKLKTALAIDKKAKGDAKAIDAMVIAGKISLLEGAKIAALPDESRGYAIESVQGGTDVRAAVRAAKKQGYNARIEAAKPKPLHGTYRIIYADPCWK
jgi:hypothetical protein